MNQNSFDATEEVPELTYNLGEMDRDGVKTLIKGVIPEPSRIQIKAYRKALSELIKLAVPKDLPKDIETDPAAMLTLMADYMDKDDTELVEKMNHAMADLCTNRPSFDEIDSRPYRVQQAFLGWLTGVFLRPEAAAPATNS